MLLMMVSLLGFKFSLSRLLIGWAVCIFCRSFWAAAVIFANWASLIAICFLRSDCCNRRSFFLLRDRLFRSLLLLREPFFALLAGLSFLPLCCMLAFLFFCDYIEEGILTFPILPSDLVL